MQVPNFDAACRAHSHPSGTSTTPTIHPSGLCRPRWPDSFATAGTEHLRLNKPRVAVWMMSVLCSGYAACRRSSFRHRSQSRKAGKLRAVGLGLQGATTLEGELADARQLQSVRRLHIRPEEVEGFQRAFFESIESDEEFLWNAMNSPRETERIICKCYKRAVRWLPDEVLNAMLRLWVDPSSPSALWISGLPIDEVPDTPEVPGDYRLPICESWLLGVGRILGVPFGMLGFYTFNARGGLVRDLVPKPGPCGINNPSAHLSFHRDVPAAVSGLDDEPDGFLLLSARGDPSHSARTMVCSNRVIANRLTKKELDALRRSPIRTECVQPASAAGEATVSAYGKPFFAVEGSDVDPKVTLFYIPNQTIQHRFVSDDVEAEQAYHRAVEIAHEECVMVDLQAGDLLVINNARCNHGRTAFVPRLDGSDRWLLKTFVDASGWSRPSQLGGESKLEWPNLLKS
eukprot:TRINITY_DN47311_c0_g1_i1.p1 TRINITY_DN47311_c0_g1~~TRINITY_DN47311_c0_g1_i1.p1  ORF type:complete len:458 (-),score=13.37 TRINITY_DN47311_c0_g1_i1:395-1768(-)